VNPVRRLVSLPERLSILSLTRCCKLTVHSVVLYQRVLTVRIEIPPIARIRRYCGYEKAPASSLFCRRQALRNISIWYKRLQRVYPVFPTGTVFRPVDKNLVASFDPPLVFGRPVIVTERLIHIFVPQRTQSWTEHWTGDRNRRISRLRRITIDTDRQRRVVGDGIFAPRGRVISTAGPRVNYRAIVQAHLTALINGEVDDWGDPAVTESSPTITPESTVQ
jgi:hypothetical protein